MLHVATLPLSHLRRDDEQRCQREPHGVEQDSGQGRPDEGSQREHRGPEAGDEAVSVYRVGEAGLEEEKKKQALEIGKLIPHGSHNAIF